VGKGIDFPSTQWGLRTFVSGGAGAGVEVTVMGFYLLNVRSQVIYPGRFISVGIGGGGGIRGASISNPSWTFFSTGKPLMTEDFAGFATLATVEGTAVLGGCLAYITFWGVDHDPYWINIGGVTVGANLGAGVSLLGSVHFFDDPRRLVGAVAAP
jgi:hypothetical protein